MTVNVAFGPSAARMPGGLFDPVGRWARQPLNILRRVAIAAIAANTSDATTERDRAQRALYEASGHHRGDHPDHAATIFDFVDRGRAGL